MKLQVAKMKQANGSQTLGAVRRADFNVKLVSTSYIYIGFLADKSQPKKQKLTFLAKILCLSSFSAY